MSRFQKILLAVSILAVVAAFLFVPWIQVSADVPTLRRTWTATGDDGAVGSATTYEMRWSPTRPDTANMSNWLRNGGQLSDMPGGIRTWWNAANRVTTLPAPKVAGSPEAFDVPGPFADGQTYWFMLVACDETGNCAHSNLVAQVLADTTPPRAIIDLR